MVDTNPTLEEMLAATRVPVSEFLDEEGLTRKEWADHLNEELHYLEPVGTGDKATKVKTPRAMNIRQKARQDLQAAHNDKPTEKKKIEFDSEILDAILAGLPAEFAGAVRKALIDIVSGT